MFLRRSLLALFGLVLSVGTVSLAQQPETSPPQDDSARAGQAEQMERRERGEGRDRHRGNRRLGLFNLQGELGLTDAQQQQMRALHQRLFESTKAQREELFTLGEKRRAGTFTADDATRAKALHEEMRGARLNLDNEVAGILTPEQRAKFAERKKERRNRQNEMMQRRREFPDKQPQ